MCEYHWQSSQFYHIITSSSIGNWLNDKVDHLLTLGERIRADSFVVKWLHINGMVWRNIRQDGIFQVVSGDANTHQSSLLTTISKIKIPNYVSEPVVCSSSTFPSRRKVPPIGSACTSPVTSSSKFSLKAEVGSTLLPPPSTDMVWTSLFVHFLSLATMIAGVWPSSARQLGKNQLESLAYRLDAASNRLLQSKWSKCILQEYLETFVRRQPWQW